MGHFRPFLFLNSLIKFTQILPFTSQHDTAVTQGRCHMPQCHLRVINITMMTQSPGDTRDFLFFFFFFFYFCHFSAQLQCSDDDSAMSTHSLSSSHLSIFSDWITDSGFERVTSDPTTEVVCVCVNFTRSLGCAHMHVVTHHSVSSPNVTGWNTHWLIRRAESTHLGSFTAKLWI